MAPENPPLSSNQVSAELSGPVQPNPLRTSVEVRPPLPQAYPPAWSPPSRSDVSTTFSGGPLISTSDLKCQPTPACRPQRSGLSVADALRRGMAKAVVEVFFILTCLMLAIGCTLLSLGAMASVDERRLRTLIHKDCPGSVSALSTLAFFKSVAVFLMVAGGTVACLGILGCCGLLFRNRMMVGLFGFLMALILVAQFNAAAVVLFNGDAMRCKLRQVLVNALKGNYDGSINSSNPISQAMDFTQLAFGCCGVNGAEDFHSSPWFTHRSPRNLTVPWSCCQVKDEPSSPLTLKQDLVRKDCPFSAPGQDNPFTITPCFDLVQERLMQHCTLFMVILVTVTALEIGAMGSAFIVAGTMGRKSVLDRAKL